MEDLRYGLGEGLAALTPDARRDTADLGTDPPRPAPPAPTGTTGGPRPLAASVSSSERGAAALPVLHFPIVPATSSASLRYDSVTPGR